MNLSDEETILAIQENPYMQYMLGLSEFSDKPVFDSSLFVTIRKRLQIEDLNSFTLSLMNAGKKEDDISDNDDTHNGDIKIDATCNDAEFCNPTDIDLLNDGSRVINRYIDKLCRKYSLIHPITFFKQSRMAFLNVIKHKRKSRRMINLSKSHV